MSQSPWEKIAHDAIRSAEQVECSLEEFAEGLREVWDEVAERLALVEDELKGKR